MEKLESLEKSCERVDSYLTRLADRIESVPYFPRDISKTDLYIRNGVFCSMSIVYGLEFELEYKNWSTESQELKNEIEQILNYLILKGSLERILKERRAKKEEECTRSIKELSEKMAREFAKKMEEEKKQRPYNPCPHPCPLEPIGKEPMFKL